MKVVTIEEMFSLLSLVIEANVSVLYVTWADGGVK